MLVRYLRQTICKKKPLPTPVCKRQTYVQKIKNKLGKIFFPMQKTANSRFLFFLLLRFSFCKNIKVKTIIIFLKCVYNVVFGIYKRIFCTIWLYLTKRACCVCVCRIFGHCACCLLKRPIVDKPRQKEYSFPDGGTTCNTQSGAICTFTHNTVLTVRLQ